MALNRIRLTEHFMLSEFQCPCCKTVKLEPELLEKLEKLRLQWGPLRLTSGYRCERHNAEVGGVRHSLHKKGRAADVVVLYSRQRAFVALAMKTGFYRALPYGKRNFVHLAV